MNATSSTLVKYALLKVIRMDYLPPVSLSKHSDRCFINKVKNEMTVFPRLFGYIKFGFYLSYIKSDQKLER